MRVVRILIAHKCKRNSGQQKLIFLNLNTNQDGSITIEELTSALVHFHPDRNSALEEAKKIISNLSKSGTLDYSEWLIASADQNELLAHENLKNVFDFFNKGGLVGHEEMTERF